MPSNCFFFAANSSSVRMPCLCRSATFASCAIGSSCCGAGACCDTADPITSDLYDAAQKSGLPEKAVLASLGCGNPTALAELKPGETVLDLGSGGGIDVLLSAKRVGPSGKAYGLDMTDDMLELARRNQAEAGVTNVTFLRGQIEAIPLPARVFAVDVTGHPKAVTVHGTFVLCNATVVSASAKTLEFQK